jgi:hypothetical protein
MRDNARWTAATIMMDGGRAMGIEGGSVNGQQWCNGRLDSKATAMGIGMAVAQWVAQWVANNHQWMRGQKLKQCLVSGQRVSFEIWASPSKNYPSTNVYIHTLGKT